MAAEPLFQDMTLHLTAGWTGIVGANGVGKTTLLQLASGLLEPDSGQIAASERVCYCSQRMDAIPEQFPDLLAASTKTAERLKGQLGIAADWLTRWPTLSHGERKRAQIAVALWLRPGVLAIDEPTNHLDAEARDLVARALEGFQGIGLLVSHDRALLDALCQQCVFLDPPDVTIRPGSYTQGVQTARTEQQARRKQQVQHKRAYTKLRKEMLRRRKKAEQANKKRSKRNIARKDHDAKAKIDLARVTGKDGVAGKQQAQLAGRLAQAEAQMTRTNVKKEYTVGIWLPGSVSKRDFLLSLPAGSLTVGASNRLEYPKLLVRPDDRIALTGPNGAGKSTLLRYLLTVFNVPGDHLTYVPQEIELAQARDIVTQVRELPNDRLGRLMTIVSRLGSRPQRLLETTTPSPGETRKLLLALGMLRMPHLIVMDEPTNHMDLPSVECLEQALAECPCGLLLVSHDQQFLHAITRATWNLTPQPNDPTTYRLGVERV
jgi:ATPase subunit of ABC transporter with duplicated ATPase domains